MRPVFAYGSNLDAAQMLRRCPRALFAGTAEASGHRLGFAGYSGGWGGAVATIVETGDRRDVVQGALWLLDAADLDQLDGYEGVPEAYERRMLRITKSECGARHAEAYFKVNLAAGRPSADYVATIAAGYTALGLDRRALDKAVATVGGVKAVSAPPRRDESAFDSWEQRQMQFKRRK